LLRFGRGVPRVGGRLALVVTGPPLPEGAETTLLGRLIDVAGAGQGTALLWSRRN
jgi:hypothetical protein